MLRVRDLPAAQLKNTFDHLIPTDRALSATFWVPYNDDERNIGLLACLLVWTVTYSKLVPREFQLETTIAIMSGRDSLIDVGTGYGKTLCMIIPCLLDPENLSVIFSPLKRLQAVQVLELSTMESELLLLMKTCRMIQISGGLTLDLASFVWAAFGHIDESLDLGD